MLQTPLLILEAFDLQLLLDTRNPLSFGKKTYSVRHFLHLDFVSGTNGTLVVAKNGDFSVAIVIELDFLLDGNIGVLKLFQQV